MDDDRRGLLGSQLSDTISQIMGREVGSGPVNHLTEMFDEGTKSDITNQVAQFVEFLATQPS